MPTAQTTVLPGLGIGAPKETFNLYDETQFTPDSNTLSGVAVITSNKGPTTPVFCTNVQQVRRLFGPVTQAEGWSKQCLNKAVTTMPHWVVRVVDPATAKSGALGFNFGKPASSSSNNTSGAVAPSMSDVDLSSADVLNQNDLIFSAVNEGDWINGYSVKVTNFRPASRQFDVQVYPPNVSNSALLAPVETFTVTLEDSKNGFSQQQEITQTINNGSQGTSSSYIKVTIGNAFNTLDYIFSMVTDGQKDNPRYNVTYGATFANGANGNWPTDTQIAQAYEVFADTQKYDFWVMATYGFTSDTVIAALNDTVAQRPGDCIGVVDMPPQYQDTAGDGVKESEWMNASGITSNRMFVVTGDIYEAVIDLGSNNYLPPSGSVVQQLGASWQSNGLFLAVAGRKRGALPDVLDLKVRYSEDALDLLANSRINPIVPNPNGGFMIGDCLSAQTYTSMLSFMQVVVGIIYIRRLVLNIAGNYEFDNITEREMYYIQRQIMQPLQNLVNEQSLQGAMVVCDTTNNPQAIAITGVLNIGIYISFYGLARQIKIDAYLTKDSSDFATLQQNG